MKGKLKAFLFDLDDTLYDEMTFVRSGFLAVANYLVVTYNIDQTSNNLQHEMLDLLTKQGRGDIFDRILHKYNLFHSEMVSTLVDVYRTHQPKLTLYPDVKQVLKILQKRGFCLGLVTDGLYTVQQIKVNALTITDWLDVIVYTDELGRQFWKPHPAAFQQVLNQFQVDPEHAAYVGNDPTKDFIGPQQLGMLAIQIHRPGKKSFRATEADMHITSLYELLNLLGNDYGNP